MRVNLFAVCVLFGLAGRPADAAPVFYCDAKSARERAEEIRTIRSEFLPGLKEIVEGPPGLGDRAHAVQEFRSASPSWSSAFAPAKSCATSRLASARPGRAARRAIPSSSRRHRRRKTTILN